MTSPSVNALCMFCDRIHSFFFLFAVMSACSCNTVCVACGFVDRGWRCRDRRVLFGFAFNHKAYKERCPGFLKKAVTFRGYFVWRSHSVRIKPNMEGQLTIKTEGFCSRQCS